MTGLNIANETVEKRSSIVQQFVALALTVGAAILAIVALAAVALISRHPRLSASDGRRQNIAWSGQMARSCASRSPIDWALPLPLPRGNGSPGAPSLRRVFGRSCVLNGSLGEPLRCLATTGRAYSERRYSVLSWYAFLGIPHNLQIFRNKRRRWRVVVMEFEFIRKGGPWRVATNGP